MQFKVSEGHSVLVAIESRIRLRINNNLIILIILICILSCTVFQLPCSSGQIIAFDKGLPCVNALVLGNIAKK